MGRIVRGSGGRGSGEREGGEGKEVREWRRRGGEGGERTWIGEDVGWDEMRHYEKEVREV